MARKRKCRICPKMIPDTRHPNAVTCDDVCAAENDRLNRNRISREIYAKRRKAAAAASP